MSFNGEMLVLARESRRMTQRELADASATKQSAISKAEAGLVQPQPSSIDAWASALRYRREFFLRNEEAPAPPRTLFRKRASLPQGETKAIKASIAIQCMHVEALARSVDLPEPDVPALKIGEDARSAQEAAQIVRHQWRIPAGPVPNLIEQLEDHTIVVVPLQNKTDAFMGLSVFERSRALPPIMFFNGDAPADRVRWTIAHELGHVVLHHHQSCISEHCEDEADEFASEFLMPERDIKHHFSAGTGLDDLAQLKLHWRVSMQSLLVRAQALGRLTKAQSTRLWKLLSMLGYRRHEPNTFALEQLTLLPEMVRVHIEDLDFTVDDLATLLALEPDEVRELYKPELRSEQPAAPRLRLVE
jgi:Zn-dependent peptidase ImmA (M78 family)